MHEHYSKYHSIIMQLAVIFASFLVSLVIVLKEPYKYKFSRGLQSPDTHLSVLEWHRREYQQNPRRFSPATCHLPTHGDPGTH